MQRGRPVIAFGRGMENGLDGFRNRFRAGVALRGPGLHWMRKATGLITHFIHFLGIAWDRQIERTSTYTQPSRLRVPVFMRKSPMTFKWAPRMDAEHQRYGFPNTGIRNTIAGQHDCVPILSVLAAKIGLPFLYRLQLKQTLHGHEYLGTDRRGPHGWCAQWWARVTLF